MDQVDTELETVNKEARELAKQVRAGERKTTRFQEQVDTLVTKTTDLQTVLEKYLNRPSVHT